MSLNEEWIQRMWYIYTMEYYSAIKNKDFMKFTGKWMDLENIILSEVNQSQKNTHGNIGTKSGTETEGKATQRLPHLGIHPTCRHQTQTLLWMSRSAYWQELDIAVSWDDLPDTDQYRCRCSQPTIRLSTGDSNGGVRGRTEGAEEVCNTIGRTISTN